MSRARGWAMRNIPVLILLIVFLTFSLLDHRFFEIPTILNVAGNASYIGIVAVGMTLVLMTAGIDLSVGSMLYLTAVIVGDVVHAVALPIVIIPLIAILVGIVLGSFNGLFISVFRVIPFIMTLGMLTAFRGLGLGLTGSREMVYPDAIGNLGSSPIAFGITLPILTFALVVVVFHIIVTRTPFGRQLLATGENEAAARRAGIPVRRILFAVYVIAGALTGLASFIAMTQLGTATPGFGLNDEFDAIAAAVLGGTSLFGGRGSVFPGTVIGALLLQLIQTGLAFMQVDLYITPMVQAVVILLAVLVDSLRNGRLEKLKRVVIKLG